MFFSLLFKLHLFFSYVIVTFILFKYHNFPIIWDRGIARWSNMPNVESDKNEIYFFESNKNNLKNTMDNKI